MDPATSPDDVTPPAPQDLEDYWAYSYIPVEPPSSRFNRLATILIVALLCSAIAATLSYSLTGGDGGAKEADRSGRSHGAQGTTSVFALKPGDCFNDPSPDIPFSSSPLSTAPITGTVDAVECDSPHNGEAYGRYQAPDAAYPGREKLVEASATACSKLLDAFVMDQLSLPKEAVDRRYLPNQTAWDKDSHHSVACYLRFPSHEQARSVREDSSILVPEQVRYLHAVKAYNDIVGELDPTKVVPATADATPDPLDPARGPADPSGGQMTWTAMRDLAARMPAVASEEAKTLDAGPWSPDVRKAVDGLLAVKAKTLPIWERAARAADEQEFVKLLYQAQTPDDHKAALEVRAQLGLSTKVGQLPIPPGQKVDV